MRLRRRTPEDDPPRVLAALEGSVLCCGDLPDRPRLTLEEWQALSPHARQESWDVGIDAVRRVDHAAWGDRIRELGRARYEPAVPVLVHLWERCPVTPVRNAVAHALFDIGTPEARNALRASIDDHDDFARFMALKVVFTDNGPAWDALSWLFTPERLSSSTGVTLAHDALGFLSPSSWSSNGPGWTLDALRTLIADDRRWLDLCVSLRNHQELGSAARKALRSADPRVTDPALDEAAAATADAARRRLSPARVPAGLLARYERGDHRGVWQDLRDVGHLDSRWRAVADEIAVATMVRVRRNTERLVASLVVRGWPIDPNVALTPPPADLEERLAALAQLTGASVPPALGAFWRIVGGINLVPDTDAPMPPGVPPGLILLDPLEVDDLGAVWFAVEEWQEQREGHHPELAGPIEVPICPDELHKANISGGAPYATWLPDDGADPLVREENHRLCLTDYLRLAFDNRGFTRLRDGSDQVDAVRWVDGLDIELEAF